MALFDGERLKSSATTFAKGFTPGQKVVTGLLALILLGAGYVYSQYAGRPQYAPLFTNLTAADASAMTTKLSSDGVPYQLADGGTAILVPQGSVNQERLNLAQANLPAGGSVGLELMDKEGITTSQAVQSADYQRALQGELEGTISSITGVAGAQVTLALPAQSDFVIADQTKPQASVLVTMQTGNQLTSGQVTAIVHLVASSIPNLAPGDVTVVDNNGNVLAAPGVGITAGGGADQAASYEAGVQSNIDSQLINVLGVGHSSVRVSAALNSADTQTTSEVPALDAKGKILSGTTSSNTTTEKYGSGSAAAPAGVLGTTATSTGSNTTTNTTGTAAGTGTATGTTGVNATNTGTGSTSTTTGNNGYVKTSSDQQYEVGKVTTVQNLPAGGINRLSIAVLVDSASKPNIAAITKLASAAAGLDKKRGDTITVVSLPFSTTSVKAAALATKAAAKAKSGATMTGLIRLVVSILGILALVVLMLRSTKREKREDVSASLERLTEGGQLALPSGSSALSAGLGQQALPSARTTAAAGELAGLIEDSPEEVAKVLRSWMHDRAGSR
ncbi:flagellar basal-body MS-ring/collar protein FliF [Acidothermaceae bacterium B102]|nr:flagellar basal-body MS-ring/collar protein FliF [Acidothermaceae bacterium B102]